MAKKWIQAGEVAVLMGCKLRSVYHYGKTGLIRIKKEKGKRNILYCAEDIPAALAFRNDPEKRRKAAKKRKPPSCTQYRVEAVCPRCGKHHFSNRRWEGNGVPRYFCPKCAQRAEICASAWQNAATF